MGRQPKVKKQQQQDNLGKGKITPVQVAFIVDRYLSDNNFNQTRSIFRTEASSLIPKSHASQAPKSLLGLGAILDEYICLKEQKVMLDQEKYQIEQEKCRIETLLQGMRNVMDTFNTSGNISPPPTNSTALVSQANPNFQSTTGNSMNRTTPMSSVPRLSHSSTPAMNLQSGTKRRVSKVVPTEAPSSKRSCTQLPKRNTPITGTQETVQKQVSVVQSSPDYCLSNGSSLQSSSVPKNSFEQSSKSPKSDSSGPRTPPQAFTPQPDKSSSPSDSSSLVNLSNENNPQEVTPTSNPVTTSETLQASPLKHISYYTMERKHYISSPIKTPSKKFGKRDHVKGRLDFDSSNVSPCSDNTTTTEVSASGTVVEEHNFDMDMLDFDIFGPDFSLSELLVGIDIESFGCEANLQGTDSPIEPTNGTRHENGDATSEANQTYTQLSSSRTEVLCEKTMNGSDSLATSMKSITKCIRILSPVKKNTRNTALLDQENLLLKD